MNCIAGETEAGARCARRGGSRGGYALIALVLLIAAVGLLFGLGRLSEYRHRCEWRFDRQFELEKIMAARSAVNYLQKNVSCGEGEKIFAYNTARGREITTTIAPAKRLYDLTFDSGWGSNYAIFPVPDYCQPSIDYKDIAGEPEYVMSVKFASEFSKNHIGRRAGFAVDFANTWTSDPFGRRYVVGGHELNRKPGEKEADTMRLYLAGEGRSLVAGEEDLMNASVIVMEQTLDSSFTGGPDNSRVRLYCRRKGSNTVDASWEWEMNSLHAKGFLLSGRYATLFEHPGDPLHNPWVPKATTNGLWTVSLPEWVTEDFETARFYLEVESVTLHDDANIFASLYVLPAYRFEVSLGWVPPGKTNYVEDIATVVQYLRKKPTVPVYYPVTFDSHGAYDWQRKIDFSP